MNRARYVVGVLLVVSIPPGVLWWFLIHPFVDFWRALGARVAMTVVAGSMLGTAVGLVFVRDALMGTDLGTQWPLVALAPVLVSVAVTLGIRRRKYLSNRMLAGMPELEDDAGTLLTEGPYAVMRHPRYVEVVLGVFAYACFANYTGAWIVALASLPGLHGVVLLEERELRRRFGEAYEAYRSQVPRYIPRRRG